MCMACTWGSKVNGILAAAVIGMAVLLSLRDGSGGLRCVGVRRQLILFRRGGRNVSMSIGDRRVRGTLLVSATVRA